MEIESLEDEEKRRVLTRAAVGAKRVQSAGRIGLLNDHYGPHEESVGRQPGKNELERRTHLRHFIVSLERRKDLEERF